VPAELNDIVHEALSVFEGRMGGIDMRVDLAPNLPTVLLDAGQVKRVVVNLVDNAAEAMQDAPYKSLIVTTSLAAPDIVELCIADSGCGISTDDKAKLFLPYYSTKERGSGLGLAIVSRIIAEHRGSIRVEDNQPTGARFIIEFPAFSGVENEAKQKQAEPA
jgi:signal transduction histidine kinase